MGFVQGIVNYLLWLPVKWLLELLNVINHTVDFLSKNLLETILFGTSSGDFKAIMVPHTFYRMAIIGGGIWMIIFMITTICALLKTGVADDELTLWQKVWNSIKQSCLGIFIVIATPLMVWLLIKISSLIEEGIMLAFGTENNNIADLLYSIGDPNWDGTVVTHNGHFPTPDNINDWNMLVELLATTCVLFFTLLIMLNVIMAIFTMYFYFIMTIFFAAAMSFDDGKRFKDYALLMIGDSAVVASTMIIFSVYASLLGEVMRLMQTLDISGGGLTKMLLSLVIAVGGALFVLSGSQYVGNFIGTNIAGIADAKSSLGAITAGFGLAGMLGMGAIGFGKRALVGKKNLASSAAGAAGRFMSGGGAPNASSGESESSSGYTAAGGAEAMKNRYEKQRAAVRDMYSRGGLAGLFAGAGRTVHGVSKTAFHAVGSMVGTKKWRMEQRAKFGASMSTLSGHVATGVAKVAGVASVAGAAIMGAAGIGGAVHNARVEKRRVFEKMANSDVYKAKATPKPQTARTAKTYTDKGGVERRENTKSRFEIKQAKIEAKNKEIKEKNIDIKQKYKEKLKTMNKKIEFKTNKKGAVISAESVKEIKRREKLSKK